jgi:hypothetical protein
MAWTLPNSTPGADWQSATCISPPMKTPEPEGLRLGYEKLQTFNRVRDLCSDWTTKNAHLTGISILPLGCPRIYHRLLPLTIFLYLFEGQNPGAPGSVFARPKNHDLPNIAGSECAVAKTETEPNVDKSPYEELTRRPADSPPCAVNPRATRRPPRKPANPLIRHRIPAPRFLSQLCRSFLALCCAGLNPHFSPALTPGRGSV